MELFTRTDKNVIGTLTGAYLLTLLARGAEILLYFSLLSVLSVEQVGLYSWGIAISAFFAIALDLGLNQILIRDFSRRAIDVGFALRGSLLIRAPLILIGVAVLVVWRQLWLPSMEAYWVVVVASLIQILTAAEGFCFTWLKSHAKQNLANAIGAIDPIGRLVVF